MRVHDCSMEEGLTFGAISAGDPELVPTVGPQPRQVLRCTSLSRRQRTHRVAQLSALRKSRNRLRDRIGNSAYGVMTTSTLQGACSIRLLEIEPRHQRAAQLSRCL